MRKIHVFLYGFIFTILTLAVFLVGCGGADTPGGYCSDDGLYCTDTGGCCPAGHPYQCNSGGNGGGCCITAYCCGKTADECTSNGSCGDVKETCG